MKKLCFGTYSTVLIKCKAPAKTQKEMVGTMLLSANRNYDIRTDDATVSAIVLGHSNLSDNVTHYIDAVEPDEISAYFQKEVIPLLDLNKKENIVFALRSIIAEDTDITDDRVIEMINNLTKADILSREMVVFEDFLAGLFIYTVKYTVNNKQEKSVKEITDDFIRSFDKRRGEITFISSYCLNHDKTITTITATARMMTLMAECGGYCPRCGIALTPDNSTEFPLDSKESVLLCLNCAGKVQASEDEQMKMQLLKSSMQMRYATRDAISANRLSCEIVELLQLISQRESFSETSLTMIPLKTEQKITEKQLLRKIRNNVVDGMYETVNDAIAQMAAENKLNVKKFRKTIKRMYEDADETAKSQSMIFNSLVQHLFERTGMKYYEACEILISYFVQSCEVFREITG